MSGQGQGPGQGRGTGQTYQTQQQLTLPAGYRMTEFWAFTGAMPSACPNAICRMAAPSACTRA